MKILIVRLSAIGDLVMASPLINSLYSRYPDAEIHWLAEQHCAPILIDHPKLASVIIWPKQQWKSLWGKRQLRQLIKEVKTFRQELLDLRIDIAIDAQGLLKSGVLTRMSAAPRRIGLGSREGSHLLMTELISRESASDDLISSEYKHLAQELGCSTDAFTMEVTTTIEHQEEAQKIKSELSVPHDYIVVCPFTTRPQKHWFDESWAELASILEHKNINCLMLGGPGDKAAAKQLSAHNNITSAVGKTSLQVAAALIEQSRGLIGVDTGLTHIGHASNRPTVAIFGSTRPYLDANQELSEVIYHSRDCSPCRRAPTCSGRFDCMRDIRPQAVADTFFGLLAKNTKPS